MAAIELQDVSVSYPGKEALTEVGLTIPQASRTAVLGPNGAGKSTLFKAILGLEKMASGQVKIFGQSQDLAKVIQKRVAYIPQASQVNWNFPATVFDMVLMGRYPHINNWLKKPGPLDREIAQSALEKLGLADLSKRQIDQLSGGQRQRVFLARSLAQEADLYLMDEPLAGIDIKTEQVIMDLLKDFQAQGKTSVVIHHDLTSVGRYFDHLVWLNGRLVTAGPVETSLNLAAYQETYGLASGDWLFASGGQA